MPRPGHYSLPEEWRELDTQLAQHCASPDGCTTRYGFEEYRKQWFAVSTLCVARPRRGRQRHVAVRTKSRGVTPAALLFVQQRGRGSIQEWNAHAYGVRCTGVHAAPPMFRACGRCPRPRQTCVPLCHWYCAACVGELAKAGALAGMSQWQGRQLAFLYPIREIGTPMPGARGPLRQLRRRHVHAHVWRDPRPRVLRRRRRLPSESCRGGSAGPRSAGARRWACVPAS